MPVVIAGLVLAFLVMLLFGGSEIDRALLYLFSAQPDPAPVEIARRVSGTASPWALLGASFLGAFWLSIRSRFLHALLLLALCLFGRLLVDSLQALTLSLRPPIEGMLGTMASGGYPSGHAANATITAFALAFVGARYFPARARALAGAALFSAAVGLSRLILGGDWPSDVIGGWALGLAWTLLLLMVARVDIGDGTPRPLRHSPRKESHMSENPRTESARANDDSDLIERQEDAPSFSIASGGNLQRDIGSRAEMQHEDVGEPGVTRVRDKDKHDGDANLPRYNEKGPLS